MFKRIISMLLVMAMVCSMVPAQALASGVETLPETTEAAETVVDLTDEATEPAPEEIQPQVPTVPVEETAAEYPGDAVTEEAAATVVASGYCGLLYPYENLEWTLYSDGHLEITGSGKMRWGSSWHGKGVTITSISLPDGLENIGGSAFSGTEITEIVIPDSVKTIGSSAFSSCKQLKTVVLPSSLETIEGSAFAYCYALEEILEWTSSVETIGSYAFGRCESLTSVYLPDSINDLGECAFIECTALADVHIPANLEEIQVCVFEKCTALTEIDIPDTVTKIGSSAFNRCTALETVSMPANLKTIDSNVFNGCKALCNIEIPYGMESIGYAAFSGCSALEAINIPNTLTTIGEMAFHNCDALLDVEFPGSVTQIGRYAFSGCKALTEVTIPAGIQQIGEHAFDNCYGLVEVTIESIETQLGDYLFGSCRNLTKVNIPKDMTHIPKGFLSECVSLEHFDIPEGLVSIGDYAFSYCEKLKNVNLPDTLTSIGSYAFNHCKKLANVKLPDTLTSIGSYAFNCCEAFTEITIPGSIETYGDNIFQYCDGLVNVNLPKDLKVIPKGLLCECGGIEYITLPEALEGIEDSAFSWCDGLKEIKLPSTLTHIGNNAFSACHQLTEVIIPDSVTDLGNYAFSYCIRLKTAKLPKGLEVIPEGMFALCKALETVTYPAVVREYSRCAFDDCISLPELYLPDTLTAIGDYAFRDCAKVTEVNLPASIQTYGAGIFADCIRLEKVTLPQNMEALTNSMFSGCTKLEELELPQGLTSIEYSALSSTGLKKITIPAGVPHISNYVFHSCTKLEEIEILGAITSIGSYAFYNSGLKSITIPDSVRTIGDGAFRKCAALEEIRLPVNESFTKIEAYTFSECSGLKTVDIPATVTTIGNSAFEYCNALTDIFFGGSQTAWKLISVGSRNAPLENVKLHFNGNLGDGIDETGKQLWKVTRNGTMTIYEGELLTGRGANDEVPWKDYLGEIKKVIIYEGITQIGSYAFAGLTRLKEITLPVSLEKVGAKAFEDCTILNRVRYRGSLEDWENVDIASGNDPLEQAKVESLLITDFTNNVDITINHKGKAFAYFKTSPNTTVKYEVDGYEKTSFSDNKGVFEVELGSFNLKGLDYQQVNILQIGGEVLEPAMSKGTMVLVKPLEYTQKWEMSLGANAKASISEAVGLTTPVVAIKAALWEISAGLGVSTVMNVSLEHTEEKDSLEIMSEKGLSGNLGVSSGITGELLEADVKLIGAEAGVERAITVSYGLQFDDFIYSDEQKCALATFVLGETLMANPNNVFFLPLYIKLKDYVYDEADCTVIKGSSAKFSGEVGINAGTVTVDDEDLFVGASCDFSISMANSQKKYSNGKLEKGMELFSDNELALIAINSEIIDPLFSKEFLSGEIEITATDSASGGQLEAQTRVDDNDIFDVGAIKKWTSVYDHYTFKGDSLNGIAGKDRPFFSYVFGPTAVLSLADIVYVANALSNGVDAVEYSKENKENSLLSLDLDLGVQIGLGAELGASISYLEELSYTTETGELLNTKRYVTGKSDDLSKPVDDATFAIEELFTQVIPSLASKAATFFKELPGKIQEGIQSAFVTIKEKAESVHNWILSLTYADLESYQQAASSYKVSTVGPKGGKVGKGITGVGNYAESKAATVSRPFLIGVTDGDTGEKVTDLSADPLTVTVRYTREDLEAAGLTQDSAVVLDGGIALYRYSDNGDYFEYIGGENDLAAMSVTAVITKTGQYVLAVDGCAPELKSLELSDHRSTPTITAYVDDMTGLDVSRLVFKMDGQIKVDGTNAADHYNAETGKFTYAVPVDAPLAEGTHTMSITLADTTGNEETYEYSFSVDLTAPVVSDVTVTGTTNQDSTVEIRAMVSDPNLTGVYAVFSKLQDDGTWSYEVRTAMGDMGEGLWGLDYQGDGSIVRVYVYAEDIAENASSSETFEVGPKAEGLTMEQDYIALKVGQSVQLSAQAQPAALNSSIRWSVDNAAVIDVDDSGAVTAKSAGTAYVTVTLENDQTTYTARCRVDVAEALVLDGVALSSTKANLELYSTDYPELEILLKLPQNYSASSTDAAAAQKLSAAVSEAYFTDETLANLFEIRMLDDRTAQIVPTAEALANAKAVKGSYKGTVTVTVDGQAYVTEMLTLSVKKTMPKLKASVAAFNSFYAFQSHPIVITGATVTGMKLDPDKAQPEWLNLENGKLVLNEKAPAKSTSGKVNLLVETAEWAVPAALTLSVKNTYKVPGVKLAATSVTVSNQPGPAAVELKLVPTNKADTISGIGISGITAPEGYTVENFNEADGTFTLKAADGFKAGKIDLKVAFGTVTNTLKLTIKTQAVKLKLSASKVSLNKDQGDVATVAVNCLTAGYDVTAPVLAYDSQMLNVQYENGKLTVSAKDAAYGKTYPVTVSAYAGAPAVKLTVAILKQNVAVKSTVKATGLIDVIRDSSAITVTPTYTNVLNVDVDKAAVLKIYSSADKFKESIAEVKAEGGIFTIDKSVISDQSLKYKAQLETVIGGNTIKSNLISLTVKMGTAKLVVKSEDTTLFSKDKNDRALVWFESVDATLNGIARVEVKNTKQATMFELIDYGDGQFAIGFRDGKVDKSLIGKTVTVALNVFLEGNQTAKANATANVKLTIVK